MAILIHIQRIVVYSKTSDLGLGIDTAVQIRQREGDQVISLSNALLPNTDPMEEEARKRKERLAALRKRKVDGENSSER